MHIVMKTIQRLVHYWAKGQNNKEYNLNIRLPILKLGDKGLTSTEKEIHNILKENLPVDKFDNLHNLISECWDNIDNANNDREKRIKDKENRIKKKNLSDLEKKRLQEEKKIKFKNTKLKQLEDCFEYSFLNCEKFYFSDLQDLFKYEKYLELKIKFIQNWFEKSDVISFVPDIEQSKVIGCLDNNIHVIARAGSGKTATLINRIYFLCCHCNIPFSEFLVLTFNKKAKIEIQNRLSKILNISSDKIEKHIFTFHKLGTILSKTTKILADDKKNEKLDYTVAIHEIIQDYLADESFSLAVKELLYNSFIKDLELNVFKFPGINKSIDLQKRRIIQQQSLDGKIVKSYGEKVIANFLFEHDIPYLYEKRFLWNNSIYRPDFTIELANKSGVIIEYFGIENDSDYNKMTKEKIKYWNKRKKWKLVKIFPNDIRNKSLDEIYSFIKCKLEENNIYCKKLPDNVIWDRIKTRVRSDFAENVSRFISLCRSSCINSTELEEMINNHTCITEEEESFINLSKIIYSSYEDRIKLHNEDDFNGVISSAISEINNGRKMITTKDVYIDISKLQFLMIDEFQDFSTLFYDFTTAVLKTNERINFFAVGDDWQSINSFMGADLKYFIKAEEYFQPLTKLYISTNYRSGNKIVEHSNTLFSNNLKCAISNNFFDNNVTIAEYNDFPISQFEIDKYGKGKLITSLIMRIVGKHIVNGEEVILLSPQNKWNGIDLEDYVKSLRNFIPKEKRNMLSSSTIHSFKGLEKSTVILLDASELSFPFIHPNWFFTRILGNSLEKLESESKRLLYVAITRAKSNLYILVEKGKESRFLYEMNAIIPFEGINWDDYLPHNIDSNRYAIKIYSQERLGYNNIVVDALKANYYQYNSFEDSWNKIFRRESFNLDRLKNESWGINASELIVKIYDDFDALHGEYKVDHNEWECIKTI